MQKNKLTLLGMSGVGKTHLATILQNEKSWFHYSGDYRIGKYLDAEILANIKNYMCKDKYLHELLENNSIKVANNIEFDNLSSIANFLGKVGNPNLGGLQLAEFNRRQNLHLNAEKQAMLDVDNFIIKAKNQGIDNFINDAGGSLCEIDDDNIYQKLADKTLIVYLKADDKVKQELINRSISSPKPLYYNPDFLKQQLDIYLKNHNFEYVAQINPDDFVAFVFPYLVKYREPKYQSIADKFGITINASDMYLCKNSADFFELVEQQCR